MKEEFNIGDTVKVVNKKTYEVGIVTDKETYIDVFGEGHRITDYWINNSHSLSIKHPDKAFLSTTRLILTEKIKHFNTDD